MATGYSVINTEKTILVTRQGDFFKVATLSGKNEITLKSSNFQGLGFKYPNDFIRQFCLVLNEDPSCVNILISSEANDMISTLLTFNRIDN